MKQIYESPEITIFNVADVPIMHYSGPLGFGQSNTEDGTGYGEFTNSNSTDDQSTPWYRP